MAIQTEAEHPSWAAKSAIPASREGAVPTMEVLAQGIAKAEARLVMPMRPAHIVEASFGDPEGLARVLVDGKIGFEEAAVSGEKLVQVQLEGSPPRVLNVRFLKSDRPQIEFQLEGVLVGEV